MSAVRAFLPPRPPPLAGSPAPTSGRAGLAVPLLSKNSVPGWELGTLPAPIGRHPAVGRQPPLPVPSAWHSGPSTPAVVSPSSFRELRKTKVGAEPGMGPPATPLLLASAFPYQAPPVALTTPLPLAFGRNHPGCPGLFPWNILSTQRVRASHLEPDLFSLRPHTTPRTDVRLGSTWGLWM